MSVTILPDVERLLVDYLLAQSEVTTICADRVYTELPESKVFPLVRLHQYGSLPVSGHPRWVETATVQIEAYGGPKRTAFVLAETVAQVLERAVGTHDEGVVSGVSFSGFADVPDETFTPVKPRRLFLAFITTHP